MENNHHNKEWFTKDELRRIENSRTIAKGYYYDIRD